MLTRRTLLAASGVALVKGSFSTASNRVSAIASADAALRRCLGDAAAHFHLTAIPTENGHQVFESNASAGQVEVKGSTPVAALRGVYTYLRDHHLGMLTWGGRRLAPLSQWPDQELRRVVCPYRFTQYLNPCTFGYSAPFWSWDRWERELDWMAFHGINMPLALEGQEAIWQRLWSSFGVTEAEWRRFTTGPAHLPWHRMGNINRFDGPLPQGWIDQKRALQKKILQRMTELGMTPIVPGFAGHVPEACKRVYPQARITTLLWGDATGLPRETKTFMLHPGERELFQEIGRRFIQMYQQEFGVGGYYLSDPFNELQVPVAQDHRYEDLKQFSSNIYAGIRAGDPNGVWVTQGWQYANDPKFWDKRSTEAFLSGVSGDQLLTIDYAGDMDSVHELEYHNAPDAWKRLDAFYGKPWINGMAHTFGGNNNVKGNLPLIASKPAAVLTGPSKGNLVGWGIDMEGIESNEVVYELMTDVGWSAAPIELATWIPGYCLARYGAYSEAMKQAWQLLLASAYGSCVWKTRHAFQSLPSLDPRPQHVDTGPTFQQAVELFASCAGELKSCTFYRNDLIELVVQSVGGSIDRRLSSACQAHKEGRATQRDTEAGQALGMLARIDALLYVRPERRLEKWVNDARSWASSPDEAPSTIPSARLLITYWGWKELADYASRLWSGLVTDYYQARWEIFFAALAGKTATSVEVWTQNWLSTPYMPRHPVAVEDVSHEALSMLRDCKAWA